MNNGSSGEPQPHFEIPAAPQQGGEVSNDQAVERAAAAVESAVGRQAPPPPAAAPPPPPPTTPVTVDNQTPAPPPADDSQGGVDNSAGHGHVIERQWIDKAKSIIAQTQDDPFVQKKEMSKAKAEYIQKRFNKTLPVDDTATT